MRSPIVSTVFTMLFALAGVLMYLAVLTDGRFS
jgi:hypothetical protein